MKKVVLTLVTLSILFSSVFADPSTEKCLASVRILKECADFGAKYGAKNCEKYSDFVFFAFPSVGNPNKIDQKKLNEFSDSCKDFCINSQKFYQIYDKKIEECKTGKFSKQDLKIFNSIKMEGGIQK